MEFKQLDIKQEGSWFKRTFLSQHGKKSILYIAIGAIVGPVFLLLTNPIADIAFGSIAQSVLVGALFGFFITNNPCVRNKC